VGPLSGARAFRAPGRVNLIGDHTDYNDGFVLPFAIELECVVRGRRSDDGVVRLRSREIEGEVELPADGSADPLHVEPPWGRYVAGVLRSLAERGRDAVGFTGEIASSVPTGSGLSSSAAFEVSLALALSDAAGLELPPHELALACQAADHAMGVPSGIMDQLTSVAGRRGAALLIDCRSLEARPIAMPEELATVVVHTGMPRALAGSEYAERRRACEAVARRLGVPALRDATPAQVADEPRARHVVSENARVLAAADALAAGDAETLGRLLRESHASLRDDFEVSTPELDALVEALEGAGALGARLTGAGFGGCAVALAERSRAEAVARDGAERYRAATGREPTAWIFRPADGAGPIEEAA
jgi:galactokinase